MADSEIQGEQGPKGLYLAADNTDWDGSRCMEDDDLLEKLGLTPDDIEQHILEVCYLHGIPAPDGGEARPKNVTPEIKRLFFMRKDEALSEGWRNQANERYQALRYPERAAGDSTDG
jgi:hypothetical protein